MEENVKKYQLEVDNQEDLAKMRNLAFADALVSDLYRLFSLYDWILRISDRVILAALGHWANEEVANKGKKLNEKLMKDLERYSQRDATDQLGFIVLLLDRLKEILDVLVFRLKVDNPLGALLSLVLIETKNYGMNIVRILEQLSIPYDKNLNSMKIDFVDKYFKFSKEENIIDLLTKAFALVGISGAVTFSMAIGIYNIMDEELRKMGAIPVDEIPSD